MKLFRRAVPDGALGARKGLFAALALALVLSLYASTRPVAALTSYPAVQIVDSNWCGQATWTIYDMKDRAMLFNGAASCTTVEDNGVPNGTLHSIVGPKDKEMELWVRFQNTGHSTCSDGGPVTVDLDQFMAGHGSPGPYPGTSCSFTIDPFPNHEGLVSGGLTGMVGACKVAGGCASDSDFTLISIRGSFKAHYRGP